MTAGGPGAGSPDLAVDLRPLFAPRQVAVLGVSRHPDKLGHRLLRNLLDGGFAGEVLPVHPSGETVLGLPTVREPAALPRGVDLGLVSLPAAAVGPAVRALGERGCRVCVVLASGFGETGEAGAAVQAELGAVARATGMRIVGPNCMGVVDVPGGLNGSYFWDVPRRPGGVSFVSQSGAYGGLFFREARTRDLGVARFVSVGNQADVGLTECLAWLAGDPATTVVALFVEGVPDGRAFVEAARRAAGAKPVVALKAGRAEAGRRAAGSHTGSLAGAWAVYRAAFREAGVLAAEDTEEFFDAVVALDRHGSRLPAGPAVVVLTVSGGPAVVAADAAEAAGLAVPALPPARRAALRRHLPAFGADGNPVDMTPQMEPADYGPCVRLALEAPEVDGAIAIDIGLDRPEYGAAVAEAQAATGKPVVGCTLDTPALDRHLAAAGVPVFPAPERAVRAYRALVARARLRPAPPGPAPPARPLPAAVAAALEGEGPLDPGTARALLLSHGVPVVRQAAAATLEEALSRAGEIGYPVAVKTARADVLHKTEAGGVVLGVRDADDLRAAWARLAARLGPGPVLVQELVEGGVELLVGGRRDPVFGPLVACGAGGILAELVRDVSLRLAPVGLDAARAMLREGPKAALLGGWRGAPPADEAAVARVVVAVGELVAGQPRVAELDVNPLIVAGGRVVAVDALVLRSGTSHG